MQLLKTILIILVIYYVIRLLFRYLIPYIILRKVNKAMNSKYEGAQNKIQDVKQSEDTDSIGEYVDFEELKNNE